MSNLRKAAEMALDALENTTDFVPVKSGLEREVNNTIQALRQALAHPEQEPVAWRKVYSDGAVFLYKYKPSIFDDHELESLYTAPPKREWVGLTDEEFEQAVDGLEDLIDCWTQIEAKLKEKNYG